MRSWKPEKVKELTSMLGKYPVVAVLDFTGFPSAKLQQIKRSLRGKAVITMTKKNLIRRALEGSKYKDLSSKLQGQAALLFSENNPFTLYSVIESAAANAPAKSGQTAPNDIVVPAGGTGLPPGPAIGELQQAGLPARIEGGQIKIQKETVMVKAGDDVTRVQAVALSKLGIEPMRLQLNLIAAMENGIIFTPDVLHVDIDELRTKFASAASWAFNLAVETAWFTADTMLLLVQKAARESRTLAKEAGIITPDTVGDILAKATAEANAVSAKVNT